MFETPLTVVGNVVNDPKRRTVGDQEVIKFRVASNSRRRCPDGSWGAGDSLFVTVSCWGRLVTGVGAALGKGTPVIVVGTVHTSEYDDRDGVRRWNLEMRASAVGPDVSRTIVRIEKPGCAGREVTGRRVVEGSGPRAAEPIVAAAEPGADSVDGFVEPLLAAAPGDAPTMVPDLQKIRKA